ncbi:MAG: histidine phosphatase family protein [Chromatiales bacterium]|jgi:2,3-bisphosphoglycerate-dependent phosphoglycerate mutase
MPRLITAFLRHAEYRQKPDTPSAHQPFPLTAKGEQQARDAATRLRQQITDNQWALHHTVDSSQLLRAWQTAKIIAGELADLFDTDTPAQIDSFDELAERSMGSVANLSIREIENIIHADPRFADLPADWKYNSHFRLPLQGAESLLEAGERVADFLKSRMQDLSNKIDHDSIKLFVGHGAAFRHAAYHLGLLQFDDIRKLSMFHAEPLFFEIDPDGHWSHIGGKWKQRQ